MAYRWILLIFSCSLIWTPCAVAHGGVGMEDDKCVINIGFLKAHFSGYQLTSSGSEEFCEDIPKVTSSIFVIDFQHDYLKELLVDFRIINDLTGLGQFAKWDDIAALDNIDQVTLLYAPATHYASGSLSARYDFKQAGDYIGVVTARHPEKNEIYRSVFYFRVGGFDYGYLPALIVLLVLVQLMYWRMGPRQLAKGVRGFFTKLTTKL